MHQARTPQDANAHAPVLLQEARSSQAGVLGQDDHAMPTENACSKTDRFTAGDNPKETTDDGTCTTSADGEHKSSTACWAKQTECPEAQFIPEPPGGFEPWHRMCCTGDLVAGMVTCGTWRGSAGGPVVHDEPAFLVTITPD